MNPKYLLQLVTMQKSAKFGCYYYYVLCYLQAELLQAEAMKKLKFFSSSRNGNMLMIFTGFLRASCSAGCTIPFLGSHV